MSATATNYLPVPVSVAKDIADRFAKDIVVIFTWDRQQEVTHTATYGAEPELKGLAAAWAEQFAEMIGAEAVPDENGAQS